MGGKTKTKTKVTPWGPGEPFIKDSLAGLQTANNTAQSTIAANMPGLNNAISQINANIAHPPSYVTDARTQLDKTINGDFVNSNPYTGGMADLIAQKTGAQYNSTFGNAGRAHGGLAALLFGQGVGDAVSSFMGDQYNRERGMQQQATMAAPGFHQDEYTDINQLLPMVQGTAMMPLQAANAYAGGVTGATSPYSNTKTTQKQGVGLGQILGAAGMIGGALFPGAGALGGMGGLLGGGGSGGINIGGGTSSYFGQNPFGGSLWH